MARAGGRLHALRDVGKFLKHYLWQEEEEEGREERREGWRKERRKKNTEAAGRKAHGLPSGSPVAGSVRELIAMEFVCPHLFLCNILK